MGVQCNSKLLLLAVLITIILSSILVQAIPHKQKTSYQQLLLQSEHVQIPITVAEGDTICFNVSDNPCNFSSYWNHNNCELCGWTPFYSEYAGYSENKSCHPRFTCLHDTKGLKLHNVTINDSGIYTRNVYYCDIPCNISNDHKHNVEDFDNCNTTINRTHYIITVSSSRYSKRTNSHVATHVGWTATVVIIICVLTYVNVTTTLKHRLRTRNNVNHTM